MFGSITPRWRRQSRAGAGDSPPPEGVVRLEPVGGNLPEKRSEIRDVGNLTTGEIINILAPPSSSGARVNEGTALGVSAVFACVRLLSDMVAKLPIELYRRDANGPTLIRDHPAARVMADDQSELHTSFELRKLMMTGKGLGGNGYARVFRDRYGDPRAVQWVEPCRVRPKMAERPTGERFIAYEIEGQREPVTRYDLIHIRGECRDGVTGVSPVTLMRETIGTALAQTAGAGSLMKNGTVFPGFLQTDQNLRPEQLKDARNEWEQNFAGARNVGRMPLLAGGWKFQQTNGMSMVDAQFIESRRFELQEVARHYGIPPHLIGDTTASTTWGTGIQEQTLGFLNFCLDPHLRGFEEALNNTLLTSAEIAAGYYFRFDRDELASVSRQDTAAYFTAMRNMGVMSVNDIRESLDMQKIADGDDYRQPLNSSSSGKAEPVSEPSPTNEPEPEPAEA